MTGTLPIKDLSCSYRIKWQSSANLQSAALKERGFPFFLISLCSSTCIFTTLLSAIAYREIKMQKSRRKWEDIKKLTYEQEQ